MLSYVLSRDGKIWVYDRDLESINQIIEKTDSKNAIRD